MTPDDAWKLFENREFQKAENIWLDLLKNSKTQDEIDSINWGLAYVFVEQKRFGGAEKIWKEIFDRTTDHKALHQIGMVKRDAGEFGAALEIFNKERTFILEDDILSKSVNLYELCYVNHLMGNVSEAQCLFAEYEKISGKSGDPIEEACFYRLKGDLLALSDTALARAAYESAKDKFVQAGDSFGTKEIDQRIAKL